MGRADDGEPVLRLGVADRVARRRACRPPRGPCRRAGEDLRQDVARAAPRGTPRSTARTGRGHPSRRRRDSAFAAAISPNVRGSSTSGGKKSSVPMIARSSLTRYAAASSGGSSPAMSSSGGAAAAAPKPGERLGQQVGAELRGTAAAVGQVGQADGRDSVERGHRPMIGVGRRRAVATPWCSEGQPVTIGLGSGRVPVGPPVFKTGDAALGVAWWVRLPRVPARGDPREDRCRRSRSDRPRPPSVERC